MLNENEKYLDDRTKVILEAASHGWSQKKIGENLGISPARVRTLIFKGEQLLREGTDLDLLSLRSKTTLLHLGLKSRKAAYSAIKDGSLRPCIVSNYGKKSHREVCKWAGAEEVEAPKKEKPIPIKTINKSIAFLEKHGYKVTKVEA